MRELDSAPSQISLSGNRLGIAGVIVSSAVGNLFSGTNAVYMMQVYDRVLTSHSVETLLVLSLIAVAFYFAHGLLRAVATRLVDLIGLRLLALYEPICLRDTMRNVVERNGTTRGQSSSDDLATVARVVRSGSLLLILDLVWVPIFTICLAIASPWMGLYAIVTVAMYVIAHWIVGVSKEPAIRNSYRQNPNPLEVFREDRMSLAAVDPDSYVDALIKRAAHQRRKESKGGPGRRNEKIATIIFRNVSMSGVLAVGAWLVVTGNATMGVMMAAGLLMGRIVAPVEAILVERSNIRACWMAWKSLTEKNFVSDNRVAAISFDQTNICLCAEHLAIGSQLDGRSGAGSFQFELKSGEVLIVSSDNGHGKSVLLKTLAGLIAPAAGRIKFGDYWLSEVSSEVMNRIVGYAPQDNVFLPGTLAEIIARYGTLPREKIINACKQVGLHERIQSFPKGYDSVFLPKQSPSSHSFLRRLSVARAMAHEPSLLILDDPFAGVDTIGCRFILNLIKRHRDAGGVAVIATAPHFAKDFADKAMTIASGRMQAFGSPDQVFKVQRVGLTQAQLSSENAMG